ncbi:MAG: ABC transporter substrate-binding protein [Clostridium sp.]|nr:ABC transporter substrate-binding protein [Clostridium sp.]
MPEKEADSGVSNKFFNENYTPYPVQTKTVNGVDYLMSRSPSGKYGGTLVTSTIGEGPKTFNSWNSMDATSSQAADIMFDGLVTTDAYTGEVIPKLAKTIKVLPDKKSYIFELRKGLKWSDGKEITADDVVFTWDTIIFGGFGNTSTRDAMYIDGKLPVIEKLDKYTVQFTTPKPFSPFLRQVSVPIAPKHILEPVTKQGKRAFSSFWSSNIKPKELVTSGAFRLKEYVPAQRLVYERNPDYYMMDEKGQKLPYLDKYIILIVGDLNNELLKFKSKELDTVGLRGTNVALFKEKERFSDYKVYNLGPDTGTMYLSFNLNTRKNDKGKYYVDPIKQKWFGDLNFRRAVDYALDRENMVFNIASGVGAPLFTPEPLSSIYLNEKIAKGHPQNIEKAKELLSESGFYWKNKKLYDKNGHKVEFDLFTNAGNTERESIGVMVKQDLEELGITVNFKPIEFNTLVNKLVNTNDFDSVIMGFTGNPLEPYGGKNVWYSNGTLHVFNMRKTPRENNVLFPWEKRLNEIFDSASLELDFEKRKSLYEEYQQLVYDQKPLIYLYSPIRITAIREKFGNIFPTELGGVAHNLEEIFVK